MTFNTEIVAVNVLVLGCIGHAVVLVGTLGEVAEQGSAGGAVVDIDEGKWPVNRVGGRLDILVDGDLRFATAVAIEAENILFVVRTEINSGSRREGVDCSYKPVGILELAQITKRLVGCAITVKIRLINRLHIVAGYAGDHTSRLAVKIFRGESFDNLDCLGAVVTLHAYRVGFVELVQECSGLVVAVEMLFIPPGGCCFYDCGETGCSDQIHDVLIKLAACMRIMTLSTSVFRCCIDVVAFNACDRIGKVGVPNNTIGVIVCSIGGRISSCTVERGPLICKGIIRKLIIVRFEAFITSIRVCQDHRRCIQLNLMTAGA